MTFSPGFKLHNLIHFNFISFLFFNPNSVLSAALKDFRRQRTDLVILPEDGRLQKQWFVHKRSRCGFITPRQLWLVSAISRPVWNNFQCFPGNSWILPLELLLQLLFCFLFHLNLKTYMSFRKIIPEFRVIDMKNRFSLLYFKQPRQELQSIRSAFCPFNSWATLKLSSNRLQF